MNCHEFQNVNHPKERRTRYDWSMVFVGEIRFVWPVGLDYRVQQEVPGRVKTTFGFFKIIKQKNKIEKKTHKNIPGILFYFLITCIFTSSSFFSTRPHQFPPPPLFPFQLVVATYIEKAESLQIFATSAETLLPVNSYPVHIDQPLVRSQRDQIFS